MWSFEESGEHDGCVDRIGTTVVVRGLRADQKTLMRELFDQGQRTVGNMKKRWWMLHREGISSNVPVPNEQQMKAHLVTIKARAHGNMICICIVYV